MHITPTSLSIAQLFGSANEQYFIPAYQRRYSWSEKQIWDLVDDIQLLDDTDTHLLGSNVCLSGNHNAGMNRLELVDGQQRLTTVSILLQCIHDRLATVDRNQHVQEVHRQLFARPLNSKAIRKISLDSLDADEFERHANSELIANPANARLASAFRIVRQWCNDQEIEDIEKFFYRLNTQAIVIRMDVGNAKDAFKLFETINNRGLKLSPTDIIKNFILGNAARFGDDALKLARRRWAELVMNLDRVSSEAFFRNFLCAQLQRRIRVSYVISEFKTLFMQQVKEASKLPDRHWYVEEVESSEEDDVDVEFGEALGPENDEQKYEVKQKSFSVFLGDLIKCSKAYTEIATATTGDQKLDRHLRNLQMIKSVQTYGFLMHVRVGGCDDKAFREIVKITEAFMLRRHVCRLRSNENETVFAKLCKVDCLKPLAEVKAMMREYSPSDEAFQDSFASALYSPGIIDRARYCLEQFEMNRQGSYPELIVAGTDEVHVEHIIPQKIKTKKAIDEFGDWPTYLGSQSLPRHSKYVNRIGNLTLFAGPLNIGASNNPYERKRTAYRKSALKITSSLPDEYPAFKFKHVDDRSEELAKLALQLWPIP
ncbi:MAG: DUF262 domain-containing protein [Planctomycetales bacterium]|nr:DUF262 domain-containing protein [Planctomycetales bacterium]